MADTDKCYHIEPAHLIKVPSTEKYELNVNQNQYKGTKANFKIIKNFVWLKPDGRTEISLLIQNK